MVEEIKNKVEEFGNLLTTLKEKVTHSTTMLTAVAKGVTDLLGMFKEKRSRRKDDYEEEYEEEKAPEKPKRRKKK